MNDGTVNKAATLEFKTMPNISRSAIPLNRGRGHGANMEDMEVFKEFNRMLDEVVRQGISPYEIVKEIDTTTEEMRKQKSQRKAFTETFRNLLKDCVKAHGLAGQLDVREYNKGERFFIVGREI